MAESALTLGQLRQRNLRQRAERALQRERRDEARAARELASPSPEPEAPPELVGPPKPKFRLDPEVARVRNAEQRVKAQDPIPALAFTTVDPRINAPLPPLAAAMGNVPDHMRIPVPISSVGGTVVMSDTPLDELLATLDGFAESPYGFVMWAFPWGEPGTPLEDMAGPEEWQREQMLRVGERLREGGLEGCVIEEDVSSGHGIGKSATVSWMILWAISTFEDTRGVVTANTDAQLRTKTWAELAKWYELFIAKSMFKLTATSIYLANDPVREKKWRIDQAPWSKENTEAFAGMHNLGKRILVVFDEAAAIDDHIYEVTEGALTDAKTQIIWLRYGNPTRTSGKFFTNCLAAGTEVLTEVGWAPIETIPAGMKVWDGIEWVDQKGCHLSGSMFTLPVYGVEMTPDHLVLTKEGWRNGSSCQGLERAEVRIPDGYGVPGAAQEGGVVGAGVRLREDDHDAERRHLEVHSAQGGIFVRMQAQGDHWTPEHQAQHVVPSRVPGVVQHERSVHGPQPSGVEKLRRAWDRGVQALVGVVQRLLGGHGALIPAGVDAGADPQLARLQQSQLRVDDGTSAAQQHPVQPVYRDTEGQDDRGRRSAGLQPRVRAASQPAVRGVECQQSAQPVYDLIDCGPRNRFVAAGSDGPVIVHNCTRGKRNTYTRVDSRTVSFSNKAQIQAWVEDYGEDSDFVRVRVKGQFPRAGYSNFISPEIAQAAARRRLDPTVYRPFQKVLSVDPARFGDDLSVITLRQGLKVHWQVALSGFDGPDLAGRIFEIVRKESPISCIVYDAIGNGADLDSALRRMPGLPTLVAVQWGQPAKDSKQYFNQRSECWGTMRDWLAHGQIPDDSGQEDGLVNQLTTLDYGYSATFQIQLQSKKDLKKNGGKSPDRADSLALSFAPDLIDRKVVLAKVRPVQRRQVVWSR